MSNKWKAFAVRRVSFHDLKKLPHFFKMSSLEILSPDNDDKLRDVLWELGVDTNRVYNYSACKHRTFDGEVVIDFSIVGDERTDKQWLNSKYSTMQALIASQKDNELKSDLIRASSEGVGEKDLLSYAQNTLTKERVRNSRQGMEFDEDWKQTEVMLEAMKRIIKEVRGDVVIE